MLSIFYQVINTLKFGRTKKTSGKIKLWLVFPQHFSFPQASTRAHVFYFLRTYFSISLLRFLKILLENY